MAKQNRRKRAASRIRSIQSKLQAEDVAVKLQVFLTDFFLCEMGCKEMIVGYKYSINQPEEYKNVKLNLNIIRPAIRFYGISVQDAVIVNVFSSRRHSAKSIRDSIVHGISKNNLNKMLDNYDDLIRDMSVFINTIQDN